jgi:hypothetical protein
VSLTYVNSLGETLSNNGAFGASDNYTSITDSSGASSTEVNIGSSSEGDVVALSWSYQSDVVESGGGTVTTTYGSEGGATLPDAWRTVPALGLSGVSLSDISEELPEFKIAFYPDTSFLRIGEAGYGAVGPDNGQTGGAPPDRALMLTAIAAAARDAADIMIPIMVGSEGSGG